MEKKKVQSGCVSPAAILFKAAALVLEKSGGVCVARQKRKSTAKPKRIIRPEIRVFLDKALLPEKSSAICPLWITAVKYRFADSMTQTVRKSSSRIVPTLWNSRQEIFSFKIRPIPPAPTYPRMELCRAFVSKRYRAFVRNAGKISGRKAWINAGKRAQPIEIRA